MTIPCSLCSAGPRTRQECLRHVACIIYTDRCLPALPIAPSTSAVAHTPGPALINTHSTGCITAVDNYVVTADLSQESLLSTNVVLHMQSTRRAYFRGQPEPAAST